MHFCNCGGVGERNGQVRSIRAKHIRKCRKHREPHDANAPMPNRGHQTDAPELGRTTALAQPFSVRVRAWRVPSESEYGDSIPYLACTASRTALKIKIPLIVILHLTEWSTLNCGVKRQEC